MGTVLSQKKSDSENVYENLLTNICKFLLVISSDQDAVFEAIDAVIVSHFPIGWHLDPFEQLRVVLTD